MAITTRKRQDDAGSHQNGAEPDHAAYRRAMARLTTGLAVRLSGLNARPSPASFRQIIVSELTSATADVDLIEAWLTRHGRLTMAGEYAQLVQLAQATEDQPRRQEIMSEIAVIAPMADLDGAAAPVLARYQQA